MNQKLNFDIEKLLKSSKTFQNKMRQELSEQIEALPVAGLTEQEKLPPVGDNVMFGPSVNNLVTDHLEHKSSLSTKSIKKILETSREQVTQRKNVGIQVRDSLLSSQRASGSVRSQFQGTTTKKILQSVQKPIITHRSIVKGSPLKASKSYLESNKSLNKLSATSSYRLPLQRFAESSKTNIDFTKEHPDLELDLTSEQTTLFPRRFNKQTGKQNLQHDDDSVNVVEAVVKAPQPPVSVAQQDTWDGILLQNQPRSKPTHKVVRTKKTIENVSMKNTSKDLQLSRPKIKQPKEDLKIISSTQTNSLFMIQNQSQKLARQNKCNLQSFPVMSIRPECQVQRVADISIRAKSVSVSAAGPTDNPRNIKYIECRHEDEKKSVEPVINQESIVIEDGIIQANSTNSKKFYKALEFANIYAKSTTNENSSSLSRKCVSSIQTLSSASSNSSVFHAIPFSLDNVVHHTLSHVVSHSERPLSAIGTKNFLKSPPNRREVHVQTDCKYQKTVATSPSPPNSPFKSFPQPEVTSSIITNTLNTIAQSTVTAPQTTPKLELDKSVEDDIVAKIFERIRNDVPNALQAFRNTTTTVTTHNISSTRDQYQEHAIQNNPNQMSAISYASNVDLVQNKIEARLERVQAKRQEGSRSHTISQMVPIDVSIADDSSTSMYGDDMMVVLQQNPLFVQTINRIKSSAVHDAMSDDERIKQNRHEYPSNAEIKRAVKIFIDSLTLDGGDGGEKKAIKNDIGARRSFIPHFKSLLINSESLSKYTSTDSSNTNNNNIRGRHVKRKSNARHWCGVPESSTSTGLSSTELESESDVTNDMHRMSLKKNDRSSMSDGEVMSIGEI